MMDSTSYSSRLYRTHKITGRFGVKDKHVWLVFATALVLVTQDFTVVKTVTQSLQFETTGSTPAAIRRI